MPFFDVKATCEYAGRPGEGSSSGHKAWSSCVLVGVGRDGVNMTWDSYVQSLSGQGRALGVGVGPGPLFADGWASRDPKYASLLACVRLL